MLRARKTVITAFTVVGLAAAGAGCTVATTVSKPNAAPPASSSAPVPSPSHTSSPTTGPVGTTFKITDTLAGSGGQTGVYTVQATQVLDPASPDNSFDAAPRGQHLVGVEFTIKGVSGATVTDAVGNDAVVQGSNGQDYTGNGGGLAAGTDFDNDQFTVSPGTSITGWESFALPDGVTVQSVQWTPDSGMADVPPVTWSEPVG